VTVLAPANAPGVEHETSHYVRMGRSVPVRENGSIAC
jgi:hypothetical protein